MAGKKPNMFEQRRRMIDQASGWEDPPSAPPPPVKSVKPDPNDPMTPRKSPKGCGGCSESAARPGDARHCLGLAGIFLAQDHALKTTRAALATCQAEGQRRGLGRGLQSVG